MQSEQAEIKFRIPQWGDPTQIEWPTDPDTGEELIDHSNAIDITSGGGGGGGSSDPVTMNVGTVTTGTAGSNASANITDNGNNSFTLNMTIPRGQDGTNGTNGTNGTTPVFSSPPTTSTLSAGSSATASISGSGTSSSPYKFSFGIPRGYTGSTGSQGPSAISNYSLTSASGYIVLNNGFKIQWKTLASSSSNTASTITPPINFTSFSWTLTQSIIGGVTISESSTNSASVARVCGAEASASSSLNSFRVFHHTNQTRHVVMLGV